MDREQIEIAYTFDYEQRNETVFALVRYLEIKHAGQRWYYKFETFEQLADALDEHVRSGVISAEVSAQALPRPDR